MKTPYETLPDRAFWKRAVAGCGNKPFKNIWVPQFEIAPDAWFSTYGSCFAQHISRALQSRRMNWYAAEKAPMWCDDQTRLAYNYEVFSSRTANIYTAWQLVEWCRLAETPERSETIELWESDGQWRDCLRPAIEPNGFSSEAEARASLRNTAHAFRRSIADVDILVFTMGLTEGWENAETGQCYALCPGTLAGQFDPDRHVFCNYDYAQTLAGMQTALRLMRSINPEIKLLLTVSPVPLTASASGNHVLPATMYSKSVLRAVAGHLAATEAGVDYFPSYEIISAPPTQGRYYAANARDVLPEGVAFVMEHFFAGLQSQVRHTEIAPESEQISARHRRAAEAREAEQALAQSEAHNVLICEEMFLDPQH